MSTQNFVVGIDLGTTYMIVAVLRQDGSILNYHSEKAEIVTNPEGSSNTASVVSFAEDETDPLVGQAAKEKRASDPHLTVHDVKRIIGRSFDEECVQKYIAKGAFSYKIVRDARTNGVLIEIPLDGVPTYRTPTEIAAILLKRARQMVEGLFSDRHQRILKTVIAIPAHFRQSQKEATLKAAHLAGFTNVQLVAEPSAAANAYGLCTQHKEGYNILVYDFGGGTFDVSVLKVTDGKEFEVLAKDGDDTLGGSDIDLALRDHIIQRIEELIEEKSLTKEVEERLLAKCKEHHTLVMLLEKAEEIKIALSHRMQYDLYLPNCGFETLGSLRVTREELEEIEGVTELLDRTIDIVETTLNEAHLSHWQIDTLVLVGGSSRMPIVRENLAAEFRWELDSQRIRYAQPNPDEAVAYGAAYYARQMVQEAEQQTPSSRLIDTTSLDISIRLRNGRSQVVIPRNSRIPATKVQRFKTTSNNQKMIRFEINEGASFLANKNNCLDSLELGNLPPGAAGTVTPEVTLTLDANMLLHVTASLGMLRSHKEIDYGRKHEGAIRKVHEMLTEAQANREAETLEFERLTRLTDLEELLSAIRYGLGCDVEGSATPPTVTQRAELDRCKRVETWLEQNKGNATTDQLLEKLAELGEPL